MSAGELWDGIFRSRAWGRWPAEEVVRAVARTGRSDLRVLEVGCGPGAQLWYLAHEGHRPVGLDLAPAALEQATARLEAEGLRAPLVLGDVTALPFAAASFDLVIDVQAWSNLDEASTVRAWTEAGRVLAPGARLVSIGFTLRTAGADTGTPVGTHTRRDLTEGPLAGLGTLGFVDEDRVGALVAAAGLTLADVQWRTRTVGPGHDLVEELVTLARRD